MEDLKTEFPQQTAHCSKNFEANMTEKKANITEKTLVFSPKALEKTASEIIAMAGAGPSTSSKTKPNKYQKKTKIDPISSQKKGPNNKNSRGIKKSADSWRPMGKQYR